MKEDKEDSKDQENKFKDIKKLLLKLLNKQQSMIVKVILFY